MWEPVGLAWFADSENDFEARSRASLGGSAFRREWLDPGGGAQLFPSLNVDDLAGVLYEPEAGVLHARRATQLLVETGERPACRYESGRCVPADAARGRRRLGLRPVARVALPRPRRREGRAPRRLLLRRRRCPGGERPGSASTTRPTTATARSRASASRSRPTCPGGQVDPDTVDRTPLASWERAARGVRRPALPVARGRAGDRHARLPVRPVAATRTSSSTAIRSATRGG